MTEIRREIDERIEKAQNVEKIFDIIKENYTNEGDHGLTYRETSHDLFQKIMKEYIRTDRFIPIYNFPFFLYVLLHRYTGEKWNCDKLKVIPVEYREDWDIFIQNNKHIFDRWLRLFQSIPNFLREQKGKEAPIIKKRHLLLKDISPNLKQLLSIKSELKYFSRIPMDFSYHYDLTEIDREWNLKNLTQLEGAL